MTNNNVAHSPGKKGRPAHRFTMPDAEYKLWHGFQRWEDTYERLLTREGSCTGLTKEFLLDVVGLAGHSDYAYVRLRSDTGDVDFAFPGVMRKSDLPKLLKVWNLDDIKWTEGKLPMPGFPLSTWGFPRELAQPTAEAMWFLSFESLSVNDPMLRQRAGWATLFSKKNPERRVATLIGNNLGDLRKVVQAVPSLHAPNEPFDPKHQHVAVAACLDAGADYFERKLLLPAPDKLVPWMPHGQYIGVDRSVTGELSL